MIIPFAMEMVNHYPLDVIIMRRTAQHISLATKLVAIIHKKYRKRDGLHVIAELEDYEIARVMLCRANKTGLIKERLNGAKYLPRVVDGKFVRVEGEHVYSSNDLDE